jgi:hypothetical protein
MPIGVVEKAGTDSKGLRVTVRISNAEDVKDLRTKVKEGIINTFSIRLRYKDVEAIKNPQTGAVESFYIKDLEIYEVSLVGLPANPEASITDVIEKSLRPLKRNKGEKRMKKSSGGTIRDAVKELLPGLLSETLKEVLPGVIAGVTEKTAPKTEEKTAPKTEEKTAPKTEEKTEDPVATALKQLNDQMQALFTKLNDGATGRKGLAKTEEETTEEETTEKPKTLDIKNPEAVKYLAGMWINHPEDYSALQPHEKSVARAVYFAMVPFLKNDED